MGNEMLTGLLNQTNGGNWWQGKGTPTTGYGSMPPLPEVTEEAAAAPGAGAATGTATGTGTGSGTTAAPKANPNQGYIDMLQRQLVAAQNQLSNAMANVTKDISTGMPKPSFNDNAKINRAKHEIQRLQGELRAAQSKAQQGGY